ncbi:PTS galactitol transporter subunit IIB [Tepidanaerobacter syntrophicus]|uniref:PTS sugar transporter subunit IIB n=1 Tax=Tepidanaerobacter syntrophicus TaxID=224999 RepID=UPI0022EDD39E|nr:PTS sugar transporter subunit IIB [Tepidanaerobacter syntrophicus]GLI20205.1 PTS galactitol transporter subunit IIB [Tepidanaerobacter syntrophicus]
MRKVKILIACGSGIATSTVAQKKIEEILKEEKIPAEIIKGTVSQVQYLQDNVDIIMLTTKYNKPLTKPIISVFGLISGINEEQIKKEIIDACKQISEKNKGGKEKC